jgi:hypothetical protein
MFRYPIKVKRTMETTCSVTARGRWGSGIEDDMGNDPQERQIR